MNSILRDRVDALTKAGAKAALQQLRQAVEHSQKNNDTDSMAWALLHTAMVLRGQRKMTSVPKILVEALGLFSDSKNEFGEASALHELSVVNRELGRNTLAFDYGSKAIYLFQTLNRTLELGWAYSNMSSICFNQSKRMESLSYAKKAHGIFVEFKSDIGLAWNNCNLAAIYLQMGYLEQAAKLYQESLALFEKSNLRQGQAWAYFGLGMVYRAAGRVYDAEKTFNQAQTIFVELEITDRSGWCALNLAALKRISGAIDESIQLNKEAIQIFTPLRNHDGVGWGLFQMAQIYQDQGHLVKAWQTYREAMQLHTDISNRPALGWEENSLGEIYMEMGDLEHARNCFIRARVIAEQLDLPTLKADVERNVAHLNMEEGLIQKASEALAEADALALKCESRSLTISTLLARTRLWILLGDVKRARETFDTVKGLVDTLSYFYVKPQMGLLLAEIYVMEGLHNQALETYLDTALEAKKFQQRKRRAEALLGAVQLERNQKSSSALALSLYYIEKDARASGSRKLKAKLLAVKGLLSAHTSKSIDNRFFNQSLRSLSTAGLNTSLKQLLDMGLLLFKDNNSIQFTEDLHRQLNDLMRKGSADLHLIRPRLEIFAALPVSLAL